MKRIISFFFLISFVSLSVVNAQSLLKKVTGSMKDELLGTKKAAPAKTKAEPEPACACNDAELVVGLGGNLRIDYKEADISALDDGSLLMKDRVSGKYYIVSNGAVTGPLSEGDSRLAGPDQAGNNNSGDALLLHYKDYISKSGEKYLISFGGKQYGPYASISSFVVSKSKDKFAAIVIENVITSESDGKKMEEAMKNAKTDQEKMDLAMQYSQQMQQKIIQSGAAGMTPKIVTNVTGASADMTTYLNGSLSGNVKYDEIVIVAYNRINDMSGNAIINLQANTVGNPNIFVNAANTKYATYSYGTISMSDGKNLSNLFNPHLIKSGSQVYLAYMYYSPKNNAIMQCKIPW